MSNNSNLEATVRRLADLEAIRDLPRRYAHCVWNGDGKSIVELFAEQGSMDIGDGRPIVGRENLKRDYGDMLTGIGLYPYVHNHVVELDGDQATGHCYLDLRATMGDQSMIGSGWYDDSYVRENGAWKFASRVLHIRFLVPVGEGWADVDGKQGDVFLARD